MLDKLKEFPLKDEMEVPEVNECPIEGMEERLKRRLQKPLKIAKLNCKKLEDKINHSGLEENKNYLASLSSKIRSIAKGIEKEFITFISEVELELIIKKFKWPSDSRLVVKLRLIFDRLLELTEKNFSYCNTSSFLNGQMWTGQIEKNPLENQKEFDDQLETIILNAKLGILENELSAKIVAFEEQEPQDVDGFMEFSEYFKLEWNKIEQKTEQLKRNNAEKKEDYSKRLDDLAEIAMKKTAPLKAIITKKLDQLCPGSLKNFFGQKLDNTAFSFAKLKEAVEQDKKMVLAAYQVKDKITSTMK
uniref:Uncharacterized protein n=1 Tax=Globodera pallida TaxID=36090 RepID=A0A183BWM8_GLOPA